MPLPTARAYWRYPLYASGTGSDIPDVHPFWQILYDQGADVIVAGHAYRYERFDRIKPNPDPEKYGIPDSVTVSASSSSGPDVDMDSFVVLR